MDIIFKNCYNDFVYLRFVSKYSQAIISLNIDDYKTFGFHICVNLSLTYNILVVTRESLDNSIHEAFRFLTSKSIIC